MKKWKFHIQNVDVSLKGNHETKNKTRLLGRV